MSRGRRSGGSSEVPIDTTPDCWDVHWDAYACAASHNPAQEYRRRLAIKMLSREGPPSRLLDIGSGQGDFLRVASRRWPSSELLGIEVSEVGISQARDKAPKANFLKRDLTSHETTPSEFDGWATHALCSEVLEHVDQPHMLLRNAKKFLAPGCRLVVTVPGGRMSAFDSHIGHRQHFTPQTLADVLSAAGFEVELVTGAGFPFFNLYRSLIIRRGDRLIDDITGVDNQGPSALARAAMLFFRPLFHLNLTRSKWGTQTVGVARPR